MHLVFLPGLPLRLLVAVVCVGWLLDSWDCSLCLPAWPLALSVSESHPFFPCACSAGCRLFWLFGFLSVAMAPVSPGLCCFQPYPWVCLESSCLFRFDVGIFLRWSFRWRRTRVAVFHLGCGLPFRGRPPSGILSFLVGGRSLLPCLPFLWGFRCSCFSFCSPPLPSDLYHFSFL